MLGRRNISRSHGTRRNKSTASRTKLERGLSIIVSHQPNKPLNRIIFNSEEFVEAAAVRDGFEWSQPLGDYKSGCLNLRGVERPQTRPLIGACQYDISPDSTDMIGYRLDAAVRRTLRYRMTEFA